MDTYQEKTAFLQSEIVEVLTNLVKQFGEPSNYIEGDALIISGINDNLCYNLPDNLDPDYIPHPSLEEITADATIIDNYGYAHDMSVLTIHQLAELADVLTTALNTTEYRVNQAREAFMQWTDEDAQNETLNYRLETGNSIDFDQVDTTDFYLWLYNKHSCNVKHNEA